MEIADEKDVIRRDPGGPSEIRQGAGIVMASLLGIGFGLAAYPLYASGSFFAPLQAEFGWSRQALSSGTLIVAIAVGTLSIGLGWVVDRVGAIRVIVASVLGLSVAFVCLGAFTASLASWYALNLLMALLGLGTLPITFNKVLSLNFDRQRGLAIGIALAGTGVSGLVAPIYATWLIGQFGWRWAYAGLALPSLLLVLPSALLFLPQDSSPPRQGERESHDDLIGGMTLADALRTYRFYAMAICFLIGSGVITGFVVNLVPLLIGKGHDAPAAARIAGTFGIAVIFGRVLVGFCLDRFWGPLVGLVFLTVSAVGAFLLAGWDANTSGTIACVAAMGMATGAEFDLAAYFCSRYFGRRHFAQIYGAQYVAFAIGGGFATPLFGRVFDLTGSYAGALNTSGAALLAAGLLMLTLGRYPTWTTAEAR